MTRLLSISLLVLFVVPVRAQSTSTQNPQTRMGEDDVSNGSSSNYVWPLPSSRLLSASQLAGKKLFLQRCSVCHLPGNATVQSYGPMLDGKLIAARGEAAEREQIRNGSLRMPGWQYILEPTDIDNILIYLETLEYDSAARKYTSSTVKKGTGTSTKK